MCFPLAARAGILLCDTEQTPGMAPAARISNQAACPVIVFARAFLLSLIRETGDFANFAFAGASAKPI